MRKKILTVLMGLTIAFSLSACSIRPYHVEIQQGNLIDASEVSQLKVGMSKAKVKDLLGTPVLSAVCDDEWDYTYTDQKDGSIATNQQLSLQFNKGRLVEINKAR